MRFIPPKVKMMFALGQMAQRVRQTVISAVSRILRQNILDTQKNVSYTAVNKKKFLFHFAFKMTQPTKAPLESEMALSGNISACRCQH
jgi:hypothetical protein